MTMPSCMSSDHKVVLPACKAAATIGASDRKTKALRKRSVASWRVFNSRHSRLRVRSYSPVFYLDPSVAVLRLIAEAAPSVIPGLGPGIHVFHLARG